MKNTLLFIYELTFFTLISVPLAISIYLTANIFYETKRFINVFRVNAKRIR